tara:strand:- start:7846 stop:8823 length:978 start_codon:yes stop_codon:yes gene_type:complete
MINKNILVTGGAGFIGSNYIDFLIREKKGLFIVNLDKLTYASNVDFIKKFESNKNYQFIQGDINDKKLLIKIFKHYKIDGVINFAAESHVDNSISSPEIFIKSNILGVYSLLEVCMKFWMKKPFLPNAKFKNARFHQVSTDEVYGSIQNGSFSEKDKYSPNSPYSASKAGADHLVRSFNKTYGLNTTISISSNNFGNLQNEEKFIPKIIKSIKENKAMTIYGNGLNVRDWIFVEDNCEAIDIIFRNGKSGNSYNVGSGNEFSNIEIIDLISKITSRRVKISYVEDRYGHDFRYSLNFTKISDELGWKPKSIFHERIKKYLKQYLG